MLKSKNMSLRIVFMGSPDFAQPSLELLVKNFNVVGVVTQPDRPSGRGRKLQPPAVKRLSQELNLPVIQPARLNQLEPLNQLNKWDPDVIVVAAFGQILKADVLELPPFGCINVHASLLPRWRGAAPIQAAILNNDRQTGVTIMVMDAGLDTGPVLSQRITPILKDDTSNRLSQRLSQVGAELLVETLPGYVTKEIHPKEQDDSEATYAPMLKKKDGELDFSNTAENLERKIRAFDPWPGTYTTWDEKILKVLKAGVSRDNEFESRKLLPGQRTTFEGKPAVRTGEGFLILEQVQPAGKRIMSGKDFLQGARDWCN